jgi:hypothetical protein
MAASPAPAQRSEQPVGRRRIIREALNDRGWRRLTYYVVAYIVLGAVFPRVRYGGWFARLGTRGRLVYVALTTLSGFATRELVRRARESHQRLVAEVRGLGLEPTDEEVRRHYVRRYLRKELGREPTEQELDDTIARFGGTPPG